jgi:membrane-associated phospholipid phosphatase
MTDFDQYRQALFVAAIGALAAMVALPPLLDFRVDLASFVSILVLSMIPAAFLPYVAWRRLVALRSVLETTALGLLLTLPVLVFTYAAMRVNMPLADGALAEMDRLAGFHWPTFVKAVDRSRPLSFALWLGYSSFALQLLFLPTLLGIAQLHGRAYQFVLAYAFLCGISAAVGLFFPSVGTYANYGIDPASLNHVNGHFGHAFLASFHAVREDEAFVLAIGSAAGIVTFPSVHAGVALLCVWAAWPSRWLRYPFLLLNLTMALSAITNGAHYVVDIAAGGLVALVAIRLVHRFAGLFVGAGRGSESASIAPVTAA